MKTTTAQAKRTGARIEAKQQGLTLPQWKVPKGSNEEKRPMQGMLKHLQETDGIDNAGIYRYLFREADAITNQLHLVPVLRKVRARLAEYEVPYMKYESAEQHWMYWNDFTLTGLLVWKDILQADAIDMTDDVDDEEYGAEEEGLEDTEDITSERPSNKNKEKQAPPTDKNIRQEMLTAKDDEAVSLDPLRQEGSQGDNSPPLLPVTRIGPPAVIRNEHEQTERTEKMNLSQSAWTELTGEMDLSQIPAQQTPLPLPTQKEWMRSPAKRHNPYTGRVISDPIADRLQAMVEEIQGHTDWYEEENMRDTPVMNLTTPPQG